MDDKTSDTGGLPTGGGGLSWCEEAQRTPSWVSHPQRRIKRAIGALDNFVYAVGTLGVISSLGGHHITLDGLLIGRLRIHRFRTQIWRRTLFVSCDGKRTCLVSTIIQPIFQHKNFIRHSEAEPIFLKKRSQAPDSLRSDPQKHYKKHHTRVQRTWVVKQAFSTIMSEKRRTSPTGSPLTGTPGCPPGPAPAQRCGTGRGGPAALGGPRHTPPREGPNPQTHWAHTQDIDVSSPHGNKDFFLRPGEGFPPT